MNWNNKRVLVTGAGGFIGSHLTERLVEEGAEVCAFVHYNSLNSHGWLDKSQIRDSVKIIAGDICDRDGVRQAMKDKDVVFHLAALIGIPYSYCAPASYIRTNIEGSFNILQAAREQNVNLIVHTSTSEVYGTARYAPIDEAHPLQGQSPYSASKIGADKLAEAFYLSFNVPVVTVRPFNAFGPRQSARAVVPTIITQCLCSNKVQLGNVHPTRDLNYVSNIVDGYLLAASTPESVGKTINIGSGQDISIKALVQTIAKLINRSVSVESIEERVRPHGSEVERLIADNTLARNLFGWQPNISLENGLSLTIEWVKQNLETYRLGVYAV